jgi:tetratricopeptide (TPR) repeat protein
MNEETKLDKQLEAEFSTDMLELKSKLKKITSQKKEVKKGKLLRLILPIAAIAAGLILAIVFLPTLLQDTSNDGLYSTYYEPYPMALNQRGDGDQALNEAISAYGEKDYARASTIFEDLYGETQKGVYLLYQGSSLQAIEKYNEAIDIFDKVIGLNDAKITEQAQWYKVLALVKLDRKSEADQIIRTFKSSHYKFQEAQRML